MTVARGPAWNVGQVAPGTLPTGLASVQMWPQCPRSWPCAYGTAEGQSLHSQALAEHLLYACSVPGPGPAAVNKAHQPCPRGTNVLQRETEPPHTVRSSPGMFQVSPPLCPGSHSGSGPRGPFPGLSSAPLTSAQLWLMAVILWGPALPGSCKGLQPCVSSGTVPALGSCFHQISSG